MSNLKVSFNSFAVILGNLLSSTAAIIENLFKPYPSFNLLNVPIQPRTKSRFFQVTNKEYSNLSNSFGH